MPVVNKDQLDYYLDKEVGISDWLEITQERIDDFAKVTGDHQFIHVDPEKAADTPFKGTVAHGFLILSLLPYFASKGHSIRLGNVAMAINYGLDKVRFLTPVRTGSLIRAHFKFTDYEDKKSKQVQLKHEISVEIKGEEKPAMIAESIALMILNS